VSAFYVDCPAKGITARGFDQLSAKFTGTSIRVTPGAHNLGIFVTVHSRENEEYQLTHPAAQLGGLLRGSPSVTVADTCFVTCPQTRTKVILHYLEEGWLARTQHKVLGVIYKYEPETDRRTRIKDVPEKDVLGTLEGCWHRQVYFTMAGSTVWSESFLHSECVLRFSCRNLISWSTLTLSSLHPRSSRQNPSNYRTSLEGSGTVLRKRSWRNDSAKPQS